MTKSSPPRTLQAVEENGLREKRTFSFLTSVLVMMLALSGVVTLAGRVIGTLGQYEQYLWSTDQRLTALTEHQASILAVVGYFIVTVNEEPRYLHEEIANSKARCEKVFQGGQQSLNFLHACNESIKLLDASKGDASLMIISADGGAAYSHNFLLGGADGKSIQKDELIRFIKTQINLGQNKVYKAGRENALVHWTRAPQTWGLPQNTLIVISALIENGEPSAYLLTSAKLAPFFYSEVSGIPHGHITLVNQSGEILLNNQDSSRESSPGPLKNQAAELRTSEISLKGWQITWPSEAFEGNIIIASVSWAALLQALRFDFYMIISITLFTIFSALIAARFWKKHFISRYHIEAQQAVERELLNYLLVHATPVGLCIVRSSGFEIIVANDICRESLGLSLTSDQLPAELSKQFEKNLTGPAKTIQIRGAHTRIAQFPFSFKSRDGLETHFEITFAPASLNSEDVFFCAIADMTEHFEAEKLLRQAKQTSEEVAKAKVNFFASMSHEIRTPLTTLFGNLELVAIGPLSSAQRARVQAMETSAADLLQLVNDVLDFSKIDIGELNIIRKWGSVMNLFSTIATAHASIASQKRLRLYVVLNPNLPQRLKFDSLRVSQVLNNLLSNSFKFTKSGKVVIRASWENKTLKFIVSDSGCGIPDELLPRLFKPFVQGDQYRLARIRGTGLGLSICNRLVSLMGGKISIESMVDVGTRAVVILPFDDECYQFDEQSRVILKGRKVALMCKAPEYLEWIESLFAGGDALLAQVESKEGYILKHHYDYLIVTEEFSVADVIRIWGGAQGIILMSLDGPPTPVETDESIITVGIYSLSGIALAVDMALGINYETNSPTQSYVASPVLNTNVDPHIKLNVLVVEDNVLNLTLLKDQLMTSGCEVYTARSGEEAIAYVTRFELDLIFTDVNMPGMDGYELLEEINKISPQTPIYAISASGEQCEVQKGKDSGFIDYLVKPVPLSKILSVLNYVVDQKKVNQNEIRIPRFPVVVEEYLDIFDAHMLKEVEALRSVMIRKEYSLLAEWIHGFLGGLTVLGDSQLLSMAQAVFTEVQYCKQWSSSVEEMLEILRSELEVLCKINHSNYD